LYDGKNDDNEKLQEGEEEKYEQQEQPQPHLLLTSVDHPI